MTKVEAQNMPLRELVRMNYDLTQKLVTDVQQRDLQIMEMKTTMKMYNEKTDKHEKSIGNINKTMWTAVGTGVISLGHMIKQIFT